MKMNWGKGIIAVYAVFVAGIAVMVYISMTKDTELVTKDYYEKEIKYQEQIDRINNSNTLAENLKIKTMPGKLIVIFPNDEISGSITGDILFYRPSDGKKDFTIPVDAGSGSEQVIKTEGIQPGLWKVIVNWNKQGINYYNEEKVTIQ